MGKKSTPPYVIYSNPKVSENLTVYLTNQNGISAITDYLELIEYLGRLKEGDFVDLIISGPGGSFNTTMAICGAIADSKAIVRATIYGNVSSGHAMIALACDIFKLNPGSSVMLHTFTGGGWGKGQDGISMLADAHVQIQEVLEEYAQGFVSLEEITEMLESNRDKYFSGIDLKQRIDSLLLYRKETGAMKDGIVLEYIDNPQINVTQGVMLCGDEE